MVNNSERSELLAFLKTLTPAIAAIHPPPVRDAWLKIDWASTPIAGLRMSSNDFVEMLKEIDGEGLEKLDSALSRADAPTLTLMRNKNFRRFRFLLSRRNIQKEEDAFLIKGVLDSMPDQLTENQIASAMELLDEYQNDA